MLMFVFAVKIGFKFLGPGTLNSIREVTDVFKGKEKNYQLLA